MSVIDEDALRRLLADAVRSVIREELKAGAASAHVEADAFLSVSSAARLASVAPGTIRSWIDGGRLGRYHAGRVLRVKRAELEGYLASPPTANDNNNANPETRAMMIFRNRRKPRSPPE